ncbi:MAG: penicillin acylase family protein, partial [Pseudomonadota bacterium]
MKKLIIRFALVSVFLVVAVLLYVAIPIFRAGAGLPQWDGTTTVDGLSAKVTITRSEYGTPFIEADSQADLYFAQGFVHAQDRFWQMAMGRHLAQGRLSEWMGLAALPADRSARMYRWGDLAVQSYEALPAQERALLDAYAAGVNAWLDGPLYQRPPEMRILHIDPEPWTGSDSMLMMYNVYATLRSNGSEQLRYEISPEIVPDVEQAFRILNEGGPDGPSILSASSEDPGTSDSSGMKDRNFSNSWLLSGQHTASGMPLLANDPHLNISLPGIWQLQHLTLKGRRMAGATVPGFPSIIIGHNGAVAWGITNSHINTMDATLLELETPEGRRYRTAPDAPWQTFELRDEVFRVRFGSDVTETYRTTGDRAVWLESMPAPLLDNRPGFTIELVENSMELPNRGPIALMGMLRVNTVEEAIDLMDEMNMPALNVSFADTLGNIGYVLTGRIPVRAPASAEQIAFADWDSSERTYLDPADNPRLVNPDSGRIVTANHRIATAQEYPHHLSDSFASGYRANRIHEMLDQRATHDMESFLRMQGDPLSPEARELTHLMLRVEPATPEDQALVDALADWDLRFTEDSPAALIWTVWHRQLVRALLDE